MSQWGPFSFKPTQICNGHHTSRLSYAVWVHWKAVSGSRITCICMSTHTHTLQTNHFCLQHLMSRKGLTIPPKLWQRREHQNSPRVKHRTPEDRQQRLRVLTSWYERVYCEKERLWIQPWGGRRKSLLLGLSISKFSWQPLLSQLVSAGCCKPLT